MATITPIELGCYRVEGEYDTMYVMTNLEDLGKRYRVVNGDDDELYRVFDDEDAKDKALDFAEELVDYPRGYFGDEPHDGFLTDAEADADVLASAGFGTDEDYGYFGGDE